MTEAKLPIGAIGTLNVNRQFSPVDYNDGGPVFYLNTEGPATASGTIDMLRFCYDLDGVQGPGTLYQATIGFYRPEGDNSYSLLTSLKVTRTPGPVPGVDQFRCEDMDIPSTEVREGDLIGVCARNFNSSVGRINFIVNINGISPKRDIQTEDPDDRGVFCRDVGDVPSMLRNDLLDPANQHLMQVFGFLGKYRNYNGNCLVLK